MALVYVQDYPPHSGFGEVTADQQQLASALSPAPSTLEHFDATALQPLAVASTLEPLGVAPPQPVIPEVFEQLYGPSPQLAPPLPQLISATAYEQLYGPPASQPAPPPLQLIPATAYEQLYRPPASQPPPPPPQLIPTMPYEQLYRPPAMQLAPPRQQLISTAGFKQLYGLPPPPPPPVITEEYEEIYGQQPTPTSRRSAYRKADKQARRSAYRSGKIKHSHTSLTRSQTEFSLM